MKQYRLTAPTKLSATVKLPASKSVSNRALIIYALTGEGGILPSNLSDCDDTSVVIRALRECPHVIDIGAAGTAMRFMTAYLAATDSGEHVLTGTERMKHRPIGILVDALRHLGADISYVEREGFPPLRITGHQLKGGELEIEGDVSSQFISALLLTGPVMERGLTLHLRGEIISRPYIDLTLWTMREYGADAEWTSGDTIEVKPKTYVAREYLIENDWSAASYWYEMVALAKDPAAQVRLEGLMDGSKQGDSSVRYLFSLLGVKTAFLSKSENTPTTVVLSKNGHCVPSVEYDFTNSPDLAQTFVAVCCGLGVPFRFTGLQTLKIKETDRIEALKAELHKLGYDIVSKNNSELSWNGNKKALHSVQTPPLAREINTYNDHRMALAFAPLSFCHPIVINHPKVVTKSYPQFWDDLRKAGFGVVDEHV